MLHYHVRKDGAVLSSDTQLWVQSIEMVIRKHCVISVYFIFLWYNTVPSIIMISRRGLRRHCNVGFGVISQKTVADRSFRSETFFASSWFLYQFRDHPLYHGYPVYVLLGLNNIRVHTSCFVMRHTLFIAGETIKKNRSSGYTRVDDATKYVNERHMEIGM